MEGTPGALRQSLPVLPADQCFPLSLRPRPARIRPACWCAVIVFTALIVPGGSPVGAATAAALDPVIIASGAAGDATASNNQVKMVRSPAGLIVAYTGMAGGTDQVFLAISPDNGARWSRLTQVSGGPAPSRLPAVAVDGAGRVQVIWTRYDGGVGAIYHRVWARTWMAPQQKISPGNRYAGYPALALDTAGDPQVVWYGIREGSLPTSTRHGSIYEIFYTGFDGRAWSRPFLISPGLPDSVNPALVADQRGRVHAVWYQYNGRAYQVKYAERDRVWTAPESVARTPSDEFNPDLDVDARGQVSVVWEHHDGDRSFIYYARRAGGRWDAPVALSGGTPPARHPAIASTSSGLIYVVWDQDDGQVYQRRYAGRWDPVVRLSTDGGNTFPSVAAMGAGAGAVWTHAAGAGAAVEFVHFAP